MSGEAAAPELQVGQSWRYSVRDGFTNLPRGTVEYVVKAVDANTATVEVHADQRVSTELYTRSGNWLRRPATNMQVFVYSPAYEAFAFPLAPGKTWKTRSTATDPADGRRFPVRIHGTVLGWERVRVPAGEFDALKVQRYVYLDYWQHSVRGQSVMREYEWYAPALKQVVKREMSSRYLTFLAQEESATGIIRVRDRSDGGGPRYVDDDRLIYELVSYAPR
jgi:hypothetical protein